jgi:hypothetical protein
MTNRLSHEKYNEFSNLRPSDSGVATGEVAWPHQLAWSKGRKLDFKLIFEMYILFSALN